MRKEILVLLVVVFVGAMALLAARLFVGGGEDNWICVNEQWVKHGNPQNPPPQTGCENKNIKEDSSKTIRKVCTMEAKQCPDGSYVEKVPPNCDFAPCL